jgi:nicotinamidase/pyrazinamidase
MESAVSVSDSDEAVTELIALVVSGRADPLVDIAIGGAPSEVRAELRDVREALASMALAAVPCPPSPQLRARIFESLAARARPSRRAILVVDMQNDHLTPGRPLEVPRARGVVPALAARLVAARRDAVPVIYVVDEHEADDRDLDSWGAHNIRGTSGAEVWPALAPEPGDHIVAKPTYSAFTRSTLGAVLADLRIDTLVLTGCLTEIGLLATATDALQRGYAVEIPADTQAGATEASEAMALGLVGLLAPYGPARHALLDSVTSA